MRPFALQKAVKRSVNGGLLHAERYVLHNGLKTSDRRCLSTLVKKRKI